MNCEVRDIPKILRYRMLTIDGEVYILDLWGSFWKIIFPFLFWILPNRVYKVALALHKVFLQMSRKIFSWDIRNNGSFHYKSL
ncbi:DUF443 family protein [Lentibacillus sp. L22]|uniref:DUF443 family protein n=1 Tax=Lentibacillus sp. L22 TaxID=3163028 RepID=UPI0034678AFC